MEIIFGLIFWIVIIIFIVRYVKSHITTSNDVPKIQPKLSPYNYKRKEYIMTMPEAKLFRRLESIASDKYYIFPQVHLSSLLNHEVKNGQNWRAALAKIQRKSVDFVLVDRDTLQTAYAVELDDRSHDISDLRRERDDLVNEIFFDSGVALVRLRNLESMSDEQIISKLVAAKQKFHNIDEADNLAQSTAS
jgi:hypothetical protein